MEIFNKDWENASVEISRKEFADIVSDEILLVRKAAENLGDDDLKEYVSELLTGFCAGIATRLFEELDDKEV